jgi:hypothetical protein
MGKWRAKLANKLILRKKGPKQNAWGLFVRRLFGG